MTQEEKQLLLKDLCSRLPYEVQGITSEGVISPLITKGEADWDILTSLNYRIVKYGWRPYFRSMSSMTEEERNELEVVCDIDYIDEKIVDFGEFLCEGSPVNIKNIYGLFDWLNSHHFDYRGLIPMGLALEAPEGMYEINHTTMNKEEAIEIVRKLYYDSLFLKKDKEAIETLIPELKESEDERIRKRVENLTRNAATQEFISESSAKEILAWLEKQGESYTKKRYGIVLQRN